MVATGRMGIAVVVSAAWALAGCYSPLSELAAGRLLHPTRHHLTGAAPEGV